MEYYLGLNSEENLNLNMLNNFSGVGMIRGENLCINKLQYFTIPEFCDYVTGYLDYIAKTFKDKPVWYRTADLVPHQINLLNGCDVYLKDDQYLIGNRGIRRNLTTINTYLKELNAFLKAYQQNNNLGLLIPFVSNLDEIKEVKRILETLGYDGKIGIMIEIPSIMLMLDEINELGIDYYTIGMNDLTSMILGSHRDIYTYSMLDESVKKAVKYIVSKVHYFDKKITLAGYLKPEVLNFAQDIGVDRINIHYNEIPLFFDIDNPNLYTYHYEQIKETYKQRKKERSK